jgi:hypothetical protein
MALQQGAKIMLFAIQIMLLAKINRFYQKKLRLKRARPK